MMKDFMVKMFVAERWRFVPYNPRYIQKFRSRANEYIKDFTIKKF